MVSRSDLGLYIYRIDPKDRIDYVSDDWVHFASENQANHLSRENVVGSTLWDHITDAETCHLYEVMVDRVRKSKRSIVVDYRCDGPDCRRFMELTLIPLPDSSVEFASRIVRIEPRDNMPLLDASVDRNDTLLTMCSWCKKIKLDRHGWLEVEQVVKKLNLFDTSDLPGVTHGICPQCYESVVHKGKA